MWLVCDQAIYRPIIEEGDMVGRSAEEAHVSTFAFHYSYGRGKENVTRAEGAGEALNLVGQRTIWN